MKPSFLHQGPPMVSMHDRVFTVVRRTGYRRLLVPVLLLLLCSSCTRYVIHGVRWEKEDFDNPPPAAIEFFTDLIKTRRCPSKALTAIDVQFTEDLMTAPMEGSVRRTDSAGTVDERVTLSETLTRPRSSQVLVGQQIDQIARSLELRGLLVSSDARLTLQFGFGSNRIDMSQFLPKDPDFEAMYVHAMILQLVDAKGREVWLGSAFSNQLKSEAPASNDDAIGPRPRTV